MWFATGSPDRVLLTAGEDKAWIEALCAKNKSAIEHVQIKSLNTSITILKVLNRFSLRQLHTSCVDDLNMDGVPLWKNVVAAFTWGRSML